MNAVDRAGRRRSSPARTAGTWDPADLRRRLESALGIAERAVAVLGTDGYGGDDRDALRPEKVLAETALLLVASWPAVVADPAGGALRERHDRLADALLPFARNERVAALITLEPTVSLDHAFLHLALGRIGRPDAAFDRLLESAQAAEAARSRERLPHRRLEQAWMRRLGGLPQDDGDTAEADRTDVAISILGRPLDALAATTDDAYAFTHALMYATDLGMRAAPLPRDPIDIAADADVAIGACLDDQDYDLGGELLLTWPLLGHPWSPTAAFAFACLAAIEDEAGFLPGLSISPEAYAALEGPERTRYAVAMSYHTAYVMGLLCAMALRPGQSPPTSVPDSRRRRGASEALERAAGDAHSADRRPLWETRFAGLGLGQRDRLASLQLAILLRRAVRARDLGSVQALLRTAADHDLLDAPAPRQALGLLRRAAMLGAQ